MGRTAFSAVVASAAFTLLLLCAMGAESASADETYTNPVLSENFDITMGKRRLTIGIGDPTVLFHEGTYYLYPTGDNRTYNVYTSPDLVHWKKGPVVFRSSEGGVWAPDVLHNPGDGKFYLYYTVNRRIGVAVSDRPDGLFKNVAPLAKGAIDAHMFLDDDGKYYLYYASYPALALYVQPMAGPVRKKGKPIRIISPEKPWERRLISVTEAPWMLKHKGIYYLLYSGGGSDSIEYSTGYATSKSPTGPFIKHPGNPIVKKGGDVLGPGHVSVTADADGSMWMVYHQKKNTPRGWGRSIAIDPISFDASGVLKVKATRATRQPAPTTGPR